MKCPNCNAENPEGMKFCGECGAKLPEPKKDRSGVYGIGDKNVIAGDVVNNISNVKNTTTNTNTTIINNDETSKLAKCHICGSFQKITSGYECPECHEYTCNSCFNTSLKVCTKCENKALEEQKRAESERIRLLEEERKQAEKKAEAERLAKEEQEKKLRIEAEARAEVQRRAEAAARAEAEVKRKAEADAKIKAEAEAKRKAEVESQIKAEAEKKAEEEKLHLLYDKYGKQLIDKYQSNQIISSVDDFLKFQKSNAELISPVDGNVKNINFCYRNQKLEGISLMTIASLFKQREVSYSGIWEQYYGGVFVPTVKIGDKVKKGQSVGYLAYIPELDVDQLQRLEQKKVISIPSPVAGTLGKHVVPVGAFVHQGDVVVIMESMGMKLEIKSPASGFIAFTEPEGASVSIGKEICLVNCTQETL